MENKDWRKGLENRFVLSCNIMSSGIGRIEESELRWISNYWLSEIESLLQSKQKEIEKAIEEMKKTGYGFDLEGMANFGSPSTVKSKNEQIYNNYLDDLKPNISNILKS